MDTNKYISAISKLNRLTQEGKLKWQQIKPSGKMGLDQQGHITNFYVTDFEGRKIGIYEERYQEYDGYTDRFHLSDRIGIGLFNDDLDLEWEFPDNLSGKYELMQSIKYQTADVERFIGEILEKN